MIHNKKGLFIPFLFSLLFPLCWIGTFMVGRRAMAKQSLWIVPRLQFGDYISLWGGLFWGTILSVVNLLLLIATFSIIGKPETDARVALFMAFFLFLPGLITGLFCLYFQKQYNRYKEEVIAFVHLLTEQPVTIQNFIRKHPQIDEYTLRYWINDIKRSDIKLDVKLPQENIEEIAWTCANCGAANKMPEDVTLTCEYCGSVRESKNE